MLQRFEKRLGGLVEGAFARVFKGGVEPVELAGALAREADVKKAIGPARTLVPNSYVVELGDADHERLAPYAITLGDELASMVREHGAEQHYSFVGPVTVRFERNSDVTTGTYRIRSGVSSDEPLAPSGTARPAESVAGPDPDPLPLPLPLADIAPAPVDPPSTTVIVSATFGRPRLVLPDSGEVALRAGTAVIGRSVNADIQIPDAGVSRRHATVTEVAGVVTLDDLDSTNGTLVNGQPTRHVELHDGDRITVGNTTLTYRAGGPSAGVD